MRSAKEGAGAGGASDKETKQAASSNAKSAKKKKPAKVGATGGGLQADQILVRHQGGNDVVEWQAEAVLDHRERNETREFLVRWAKDNTGQSHPDSWQDEESLQEAKDLIESYFEKKGAPEDDQSPDPRISRYVEGYLPCPEFRKTVLELSLGNALAGAARRYLVAGTLDNNGDVGYAEIGNAKFYSMGFFDKDKQRYFGPGTSIASLSRPADIVIGAQLGSSHMRLVTLSKETFLKGPENGSGGHGKIFYHQQMPLKNADVMLDTGLVQMEGFWDLWTRWTKFYVEESKDPDAQDINTPPVNSAPSVETSSRSKKTRYNLRGESSAVKPISMPPLEPSSSGEESPSRARQSKARKKRVRGGTKAKKGGTKKVREEDGADAALVTPESPNVRASANSAVDSAAVATMTPLAPGTSVPVDVIIEMAVMRERLRTYEREEEERKRQKDKEELRALFQSNTKF